MCFYSTTSSREQHVCGSHLWFFSVCVLSVFVCIQHFEFGFIFITKCHIRKIRTTNYIWIVSRFFVCSVWKPLPSKWLPHQIQWNDGTVSHRIDAIQPTSKNNIAFNWSWIARAKIWSQHWLGVEKEWRAHSISYVAESIRFSVECFFFLSFSLFFSLSFVLCSPSARNYRRVYDFRIIHQTMLRLHVSQVNNYLNFSHIAVLTNDNIRRNHTRKNPPPDSMGHIKHLIRTH